MSRNPFVLLGFSLLAFAGSVSAVDPPLLVNYQGVLRDAGGNPESGSRDMVFRFFSASVAGSEILVDTHLAGNGGQVTVTNGLFDVQLGSGTVTDGSGAGTYTDLQTLFRDHQDVWMQIEVGGETLSPRVQVVSAPFALNAGRIDGKSGLQLLDTSSTPQTKSGDLTIGGQVISTVPNGTPPLAVNSTTLVSNLNAGMVGGFTASQLLNTGVTPQTKAGTLALLGDLNITGRINTNYTNSPDRTTEVYPMNQAVRTTDDVIFDTLYADCIDVGSGCNVFPALHQNVNAGASPTFGSLYLNQSVDGLRFGENVPATVGADDATMTFCVDCNNNEGAQAFYWKINSPSGSGVSTDIMMQLTGSGNLYLKGSVVPNTVFDLAELYRQAAPVEPGDLVRVVPGEPSAVAPTVGSYDKALLGVVSTRPGFLLGNVMDAESLRTGWGQKAFETYQALLPELRRAVLADEPRLVEDEARYASPESFRAWFRAEEERQERARELAEPRPAGDPKATRKPGATAAKTPDEAEAARRYDGARASYERRMESMTLERFMAAKYAPIALAGRVPVKVDASFGAIEIGDSLTSSPIPGIAMKATDGGPVIGMALEALASGTGKIEVFIGLSGGTSADAPSTLSPSSVAASAAFFPDGSNRSPKATPVAPPDRAVVPAVEASTAEDRAEPFPGTGSVISLDVTRAVRAGELLVLGSNGGAALQPSFLPNDPMVVGVALADAVDGRAPVAGAGFAVVRVDASTKPIARGDLLVTSALPGHAMKALSPAEPGTVIGKALEPLDFGTGKIRVLLMAR